MFAYLSGMFTTAALFAPNGWARVGFGVVALILIVVHGNTRDKQRYKEQCARMELESEILKLRTGK